MTSGPIETAYVEILPQIAQDFDQDVLNEVNQALNKVSKSVNKTLNDGLGKASKAGAKALSDNVSQAAEKADTSIKKVATAAKTMGAEVAQGAAKASKSMTDVGTSAEKAGTRVTSAFSNVGTRVSTALSGISSTASRVSNTVTTTFTNAGNRISQALDGTKLGKGLDRLGSVASGALSKLQSAADRAGRGLGESIDKGAQKAEKAIQDVGAEGGRLEGSFKKVGGALAASFAAAEVGTLVKDAIGGAADLNETLSKTQVLLGDAGLKAAEAFASGAQNAFGQTKQQALDAISTFAIFGKSAGLTGTQLTGFSTQLTALASDLASFNNTSVDQAIEAIGAGLRGETEPLRAFGVLMDDASLRAEALAQGLIKTTKEALTPQQKVLASQALILKQTTAAQGDFARTSGGLANQQRILAATTENLKTRLGAALLPATLAVVKGLNNGLVPALETVGRVLGPVFASIKQGIGDLVAGFRGTAEGDTVLSRLGEQARELAKRFLPVVDSIVGAVSKLGVIISNALGNIDLGAALGGFGELAGQANDVLSNLATTVSDTINGIVSALGTADFGEFFAAAVPAIQSFYKSLLSVSQVVAQQLGPILRGVVGIFTTVVVPAFNVVVGFVTGTLLPALTDLAQTIAKNVVPIVRTIGEQISKNVLPALQKFGQVLSGTVLPVLARVAAIVVAVVKPLLKLAITVLGKVIPPLLRLIGPVLGFLIKVIAQVIKIVFQVVNALLNIPKIGPKIASAFGKIGAAFAKLPGLFKKAAKAVGDAILSVLKAVPKVLAGIGRFIADVISFFAKLPFRIIGAIVVLELLLLNFWKRVLKKVLDAVIAAGNALVNFFKALPGRIVAALQALVTGVQNIINRVVAFFASLPGRIASAIASIPGIISNLVSRIIGFFNSLVQRALSAMAQFGQAILNGVNRAVGFFSSLVSRAVKAISGLPGAVANIASRVVSSMVGFLQRLPGEIGSIMAQIPKRISSLGKNMLAAGRSLITNLLNGLKNVAGGAANIGQAVANAVKGFVNSQVIDRLNSALTFKIGGVTIDPPNIPHLAKGAVLDKATLNVAGEAGREVVLPLTKADRMVSLMTDQRVTPAIAKALANPKLQLALQKHSMPLAQFQPLKAPARPLPALRSGGSRKPGAVHGPRTMGAEEVVKELKALRKEVKELQSGHTFNISEVGDAETTAQRISNRLGGTGDKVR